MAMTADNICHVIPKQEDHAPIQIVNFAHETKPERNAELTGKDVLQSIPTYRMHVVTAGKGLLHMDGVVQSIEEGDVFFSFPAMPYRIEAEPGLKYLYISYLGSRANALKEELKLGQSHCVFHGFKKQAPQWKKALKLRPEVINLRCESILLYVFSEIGVQFYEKKEHVRQEKNAGVLIKKYIDENYSDVELSLEKVGDFLGYHRKYISMAFKDEFAMGFTNYLNSVRVHQACVLMEQGFTNVKEISNLCGFRSQYYFAKIFEDHMNISPKEHLEALGKENKK